MKIEIGKVSDVHIKKAGKKSALLFRIGLVSLLGHFKSLIPENQILLFSDPRGGSTWLSEILKKIPGTAVLWEPLHLRYATHLRNLNFGWRQYIPEDVEWPEVKTYLEKVFAGKLVNGWILSNTTTSEYVSAKYFIIKICRGNMMLPWITANFNFKYLPVYLVRHPFAVVNSQLKQGGWDRVPGTFKIPDTPYNEKYVQHKDYLETLTSKEEMLTATWCISNSIPLDHDENNKRWITIYYEELLSEPHENISRVFKMWGLPIPDNIESSYRKKSRTTVGRIHVEDPDIQLSRWKRELTGRQIGKMKNVLEYFNIRNYAFDSIMPVKNLNP